MDEYGQAGRISPGVDTDQPGADHRAVPIPRPSGPRDESIPVLVGADGRNAADGAADGSAADGFGVAQTGSPAPAGRRPSPNGYAETGDHTELLASLRVERSRSETGQSHWGALVGDTVEQPAVVPSAGPGGASESGPAVPIAAVPTSAASPAGPPNPVAPVSPAPHASGFSVRITDHAAEAVAQVSMDGRPAASTNQPLPDELVRRAIDSQPGSLHDGTRRDEARPAEQDHDRARPAEQDHDRARPAEQHHDRARPAEQHHDRARPAEQHHDQARHVEQDHDKARHDEQHHDKARHDEQDHDEARHDEARRDEAAYAEVEHDEALYEQVRHYQTFSDAELGEEAWQDGEPDDGHVPHPDVLERAPEPSAESVTQMHATNGHASHPSTPIPAVPMTFRTAEATPRPALVPVAEDRGHVSEPIGRSAESIGRDPEPAALGPQSGAPQREQVRRAGGPTAERTPPPPGLVPLLPHRVPAPPDVPDVPDDYDDEYEPASTVAGDDVDGPELSRIATRLRHDEPPVEPPADLDVTAVLEAVRRVPGVANAQLRGAPGGMHTLRLDLADGADPGQVSRQVARLLKERMGLAAEPRRPRPGEPSRESPLSTRPVQRPATLADMGNTPPASTVEPQLVDPGVRVLVDQVRVSTLGSEATVEVRLVADGRPSVGAATGPAVDGYLLRLAASAAASAIDGLIESAPRHQMVRCFVDHAGVVPFGSVNVAVVVVLLSGAGWVEQLVGSALVGGDPRQAIVRATLAAVNRRLDTLLG